MSNKIDITKLRGKRLWKFTFPAALFLLLLSILAPAVPAAAATTYESQNAMNVALGFYFQWLAQTFTATQDHNVTAVSLIMLRSSTCTGTLTVGIRATDANGYPTGGDLVYGTLPVSSLPTASWGWVMIPMVGSYSLSNGTRYAIVVRKDSWEVGNVAYWAFENSDVYSGGSSFIDQTANPNFYPYTGDFTFQIQDTTNTPPTSSNNAVTTLEDTQKVFATADFPFSDTNAGDTLSKVKITTLESAGALKYNGADVDLNQEITAADITAGKLTFDPAANANGTAYATFGFKVSDGQDYSASAYTMTINVTAVNDHPVATAQSLSTNEDNNLTITLAGTDIEGDSLTFKITGLPGLGALYNGVGTGGHQIISTDLPYTVADSSHKVTYAPNTNWNGSDSFTFKVNDGTEDCAADATVSITIIPVNDRPTIVTPPPGRLASQTVDYSDPIAAGQVRAADIDSTSLSLTGLPAGLTVTKVGEMGEGTFTSPYVVAWNVSGNIADTPGSYPLSVSDGLASTSTGVTITVEKENTAITFDANNPVAVKVINAGDATVSIPDTDFVVRITQEADGNLGTQNLAAGDVTMKLVPVSGGSPITMTQYGTPDVTAFHTGGAAVFTFRALSPIPVNTYTIEVNLSNTYYQAEQGEDVFVIYDPSLGFTTGGGWFYWPGTTDKTNFGFTMKYNNKGQQLQGGLLIIRHLADGSIYRIKSNALDGLSLTTSGIPGTASFSGKCTYIGPDSALDEYGQPINEGGVQFTTYVEDWNEPGTGIDQFWFNVLGKDFTLDGNSNNKMDNSELTEISGGNIVVPHSPKTK